MEVPSSNPGWDNDSHASLVIFSAPPCEFRCRVGQNRFFPHPFQVFFYPVAEYRRYMVSAVASLNKSWNKYRKWKATSVASYVPECRTAVLKFSSCPFTADALRHIGLTYTVMAQNA
jgi:hypothetical protein